MTGSQQNTHRRFGLNISLPGETTRWRNNQDIAVTLREGPTGTVPCSCQARDIERTIALIPADGGEQHLQQHTATLSWLEGKETSSLKAQRARRVCRAVAFERGQCRQWGGWHGAEG